MFHEYAVDPMVLSSWERVRYFLDAFGPWKGRFLAEFPKHWRRLVYEALDCPDLERSKIEARLAAFDKRAFTRRPGASFDRPTWIENALIEHGRFPFRAIVATAARAEEFVLQADDLDDRTERWAVPTGRLVERTAAGLAGAVATLLRVSQRVVVIDPYFRADQGPKLQTLAALCRHARREVDVHFADEATGYDACMAFAARALPGAVPVEVTVNLHCWREVVGGPRLHNRYLLTEIAGVQFGDGIETGGAGQHDRVSILDEDSRATLWAHFTDGATAFARVGEMRAFAGTRRR